MTGLLRRQAAAGGAIAATAVLMMVACAPPPTAVVVIVDDGSRASRAEPAVLEVEAGTEVRWRNSSPRTHAVNVATDGEGAHLMPAGAREWESGPLLSGETFALRLEVPGAYVYTTGEGANEVAMIEVVEP